MSSKLNVDRLRERSIERRAEAALEAFRTEQNDPEAELPSEEVTRAQRRANAQVTLQGLVNRAGNVAVMQHEKKKRERRREKTRRASRKKNR